MHLIYSKDTELTETITWGSQFTQKLELLDN